MMLRILTSILTIILLLCGCSPEGESGLQGQLLFQDQPLASAQLEVYLKAEKDRSVQPFALANTDSEGHYQVSLPEGSYFLIGKKRETTDDGRSRVLMADSPANPHLVGAGIGSVPSFNLREMGREGLPRAEADTGLSGQVSNAGAPVARAYVYIYTETESGLTGPSYGEAIQTDKQGRFLINLPPGDYALVARKRAGGGRSGNLEPGDLNAAYPHNPVTVRAGEITQLTDFPLQGVDAELNAQR
ncbi:MAG: carboxypeptidase-like regulatory domain-containing protein, partial [Desulfuromonadales bacterium]|nr:carboxypeptidase-like regulatory domain-containing protein [Desulfuromonadales bacterium]